eukprot:COSAG01_NODE_1457_length_10252_cov_32.071400_9_plen_222_part_00
MDRFQDGNGKKNPRWKLAASASCDSASACSSAALASVRSRLSFASAPVSRLRSALRMNESSAAFCRRRSMSASSWLVLLASCSAARFAVSPRTDSPRASTARCAASTSSRSFSCTQHRRVRATRPTPWRNTKRLSVSRCLGARTRTSHRRATETGAPQPNRPARRPPPRAARRRAGQLAGRGGAAAATRWLTARCRASSASRCSRRASERASNACRGRAIG